jgi:dCMP deaminase
MDQRPSSSDTFMEIAYVWAKRSTCSSRIAVGAVLVNQYNQIIASGYNGAPRGMGHCDERGCELDSDGHCVRALHSEENAILQCALNGVSSMGCSMYVTHSPCVRCCRVIIQSGIIAVYYSEKYGNPDNSAGLLYSVGIQLRKV